MGKVGSRDWEGMGRIRHKGRGEGGRRSECGEEGRR